VNSRKSACKIQLVASRRVEGKPRTEVLVHLGEYPTPEAALGAWPAQVEHLRAIGARGDDQANKLQAKLEKLRELVKGESDAR
jgi:hypothetical protein